MAVTSGFFNSKSGDRRYNAEQMSAIFNGIINDGVFANIGTAFKVTANDTNTVLVGAGRCWFKSTWVLNDSVAVIAMSDSDILYDRIDTVVIEVDHSDSVRAGSIKVVKGRAASSPQKPTLIQNGSIYQAPLAYVRRKVGTTSISQVDITNAVGTSECPYITGILQVQNIDNIVAQWQAQWKTWYANTVAWQTEFETQRENWSDEWNDWYTNETSGTSESLEAFMLDAKVEIDKWFENLRTNLDSQSTAVALASKIADLQEKFDTLSSERAIYDSIEDSSGNPILGSDGTEIVGKTVFDSGNGIAGEQVVENKQYVVQLPLSAWEGSVEEGFSQVAACYGMTSDKVVLPPMFRPTGILQNDIAMKAALSHITLVNTMDEKVQVFCDFLPAIDMEIVLLEGAGGSGSSQDVVLSPNTDTLFDDDTFITSFGGKLTQTPKSEIIGKIDAAYAQSADDNEKLETKVNDNFARALVTKADAAASLTIYPDVKSNIVITNHGFTTQSGSGSPSPKNPQPITVGGKNWEEVVLTGDEDWRYSVKNMIWSKGGMVEATRTNGQCSDLKWIARTDLTVDGTPGIATCSAGNLIINHPDYLTDPEAWKAYLKKRYEEGNPFKVWVTPADISKVTGLYIPKVTEGETYHCECVKLTEHLCEGDTVESYVESGCDKMIMFDGSSDENWVLDSSSMSSMSGSKRFYIDLDFLIKNTSASPIGHGYTNYLMNVSAGSSYGNIYENVFSLQKQSSIGKTRIFVRIEKVNTKDAFIESIRTKPLILFVRTEEYTSKKNIFMIAEKHAKRKYHLRISDMNNGDDYPGWKVPDLKGTVGDGKNGAIPGTKCDIDGNGTYFNTNGSLGQIFFYKSHWGNLTETQIKEQYPDMEIDIVVPRATPVTYAHPAIRMEADPKVSDGSVKISGEKTVSAVYNKNIVKAFEELQAAVVALGANLSN